MLPLPINDQLTIPDTDLQLTAVRASGPGGQHVNKTASAVELWFNLAGTQALSPPVKARLRALAGKRVGRDGILLIVAAKHRSQPRNLEDARERLAQLIREALVPPEPRLPTKVPRRTKLRRLDEKRARSEVKAGRGRVE